MKASSIVEKFLGHFDGLVELSVEPREAYRFAAGITAQEVSEIARGESLLLSSSASLSGGSRKVMSEDEEEREREELRRALLKADGEIGGLLRDEVKRRKALSTTPTLHGAREREETYSRFLAPAAELSKTTDEPLITYEFDKAGLKHRYKNRHGAVLHESASAGPPLDHKDLLKLMKQEEFVRERDAGTPQEKDAEKRAQEEDERRHRHDVAISKIMKQSKK